MTCRFVRSFAAWLLIIAVTPGLAEAAPAQRPITVYGNLPGFEMAAMSPSGDRVALVGIVNDKRRLIVLDKDGNPLMAAPFGDQKICAGSYGPART